jgi:hypothetical protein
VRNCLFETGAGERAITASESSELSRMAIRVPRRLADLVFKLCRKPGETACCLGGLLFLKAKRVSFPRVKGRGGRQGLQRVCCDG